jgi:hypothetical protein
MTMAKSNVSAIFIGIGDERIELSGQDLEAFLIDRDARAEEALLLETEYKAKQDARASALTKLGEIAGLTKEELDAIL